MAGGPVNVVFLRVAAFDAMCPGRRGSPTGSHPQRMEHLSSKTVDKPIENNSVPRLPESSAAARLGRVGRERRENQSAGPGARVNGPWHFRASRWVGTAP